MAQHLPGLDHRNLICPDLRQYFLLGKLKTSEDLVLKALLGGVCHRFSANEGYALQHFNGQLTAAEIHHQCVQRFGEAISSDFMINLLQKLVDLHILTLEDPQASTATALGDLPTPFLQPIPVASPLLRPGLQWWKLPNGDWILRNPNQVTRQMQVNDRDQAVIDRLGLVPPDRLKQDYGLDTAELNFLWRQLAIAGMVNGIEAPVAARPRKFNPLQLLLIRIPLFNPDAWLEKCLPYVRWLWVQGSMLFWLGFLLLSWGYATLAQERLWRTTVEVWSRFNIQTLLIFGLLMMLVVSIHELGHALTLKYYQRVVPEIGLMFILLLPSAYTDTTDQYTLTRQQRAHVIGAGILCQLVTAAIGFWIWSWTAPQSWLSQTGFLLTLASVMTIAINLNPLTRFDGYYLAVALSGINSLRARSFQLYGRLLQQKPNPETLSDSMILAAYAPLSLAYTLFVFGYLFTQIIGWSWLNIPTLALSLLVLWLIYFYWPTGKPAH